MKKIISIITIISMLALCLCSVTSCKKKYDPVESTEEESRVVMTLTVGEGVYEVRYELYRALFLTYRALVDGGDSSVWSGEGRDEYVAKINGLITDRLAEIYSAFELASRIGYDPYSKEADEEIEEMIRVSVEGGTHGDKEYLGYCGDYDAYLSALKKMYHNYSTSVLMLRYELARTAVLQHYIGDGTNGAIQYTEADIEEYYYSDSSARILKTYLNEGVSYDTAARAENVRADLVGAAAKGEEAVKAMMIDRGTPTAVGELQRGVLIGRYSLGDEYGDIAEAAFELDEGEVSEVVYVYTANEGGRYYVIYRAEKTDSFLTEAYSEAVNTFLYDSVGGMLADIADVLEDSAAYTDEYGAIDHSSISMD